MMRALAMLGEEEVADIQATVGKIEVNCGWGRAPGGTRGMAGCLGQPCAL